MTPDPYEIQWSPTALRAIRQLPEKVATACIEFAYGGLSENPQRPGKALRLDFAGRYSARRGDFRVIYEIDVDANLVTIIAIDHRSDVYRPR